MLHSIIFFVCFRPFWQLKFMNPSYEFRFQMYYEIDVIIKETTELLLKYMYSLNSKIWGSSHKHLNFKTMCGINNIL